jgi:hypothetical protein
MPCDRSNELLDFEMVGNLLISTVIGFVNEISFMELLIMVLIVVKKKIYTKQVLSV